MEDVLLFWGCIMSYHRLSGLNNGDLLLHSSPGGTSRARCPQGSPAVSSYETRARRAEHGVCSLQASEPQKKNRKLLFLNVYLHVSC